MILQQMGSLLTFLVIVIIGFGRTGVRRLRRGKIKYWQRRAWVDLIVFSHGRLAIPMAVFLCLLFSIVFLIYETSRYGPFTINYINALLVKTRRPVVYLHTTLTRRQQFALQVQTRPDQDDSRKEKSAR